ncbi:MAG: class I SAM-dependent methyltransferase, partial [Planctomycetia bacterium]|nr:class I SAM-dependent methyltransferase [Planctomycetia bacterium]
MSELNALDPTGRFTGLAEIYDRSRPNYPGAALDHLERHCRLGPQSVIVDVGCGTGISSRQFAARGWQVIGIEPNADMRRQAEQLSAPAPNPSFR